MAVQSLADNFINSEFNFNLKKLIIKNPVIINQKLDFSRVFFSMEQSIMNFKKLNTLCIS